MKVEAYPRLADVPSDAIDLLRHSSTLFLSRGWLVAVEGMPGALATRYFVARSDDGSVVGFTVSYVVDRSVSGRYRPDLAICGREMANMYYPTVLVGGRAGFQSGAVIGSANPIEISECASLVTDELRSFAAGCGARGIWMLYADNDARKMFQPAFGGPAVKMAPSTLVDLPGREVAAWIEALPQRRRHAVRREMRVFSSAPYSVTVQRLSEIDPNILGSLLARLLEKYRGFGSTEAMASYVEVQRRGLDQESVVIVCHRNGRPVAAALHFEWNGRLYGRAWGAKYESLTGAFEYFNLAYYLPIQLAYERGLTSLEWGLESYAAKLTRGARLDPRWGLLDRGSFSSDWLAANRSYSETFPHLEAAGRGLRPPVPT